MKHRLFHTFAQALIEGNRDFLELFIEDGDYQIQDDEMFRIQDGLNEFLDWILQRREEYLKIESLFYRIEYCTGCSEGSPMILFRFCPQSQESEL